MKLKRVLLTVFSLGVVISAAAGFSACAKETAHEHAYGDWTDIAVTCEQHLQKRVCEECGNEQVQSLQASGHKYGEWVDLVNTCESHVQKRECSVCGNSQTQTIEAKGHSYGLWTDIINTCTQHIQKRICVCGKEQTKTLDVAGHNYGEWTDLINNCEQHVQRRICSVCDNIETQNLEAAGHKYGEWTDMVNTCEEHIQKRICSECKNEETRELEAEGHKYGEWTDIVNTCEDYAQKRICSECKNEEIRELEAEGHTYGDWSDLINTCEKYIQIKTCDKCGNKLTQELQPTGHKFISGVCNKCGVEESIITINKYNGKYGANYFAINGFADEYELYYRIDNEVRAFHANGKDGNNDGNGNFVFAEVEYADLNLTSDRAVSVWKTYKDDNPLYYWFANTTYIDGDNIVLLAEEEYSDGKVRKQYNDLVYAEVAKYSALTSKNDDAYRIALCYHDAIINAVDYAYDEYRRPQSAAWAHNVLGVFEKKGAVCEAYARTFQLLLNYSGIENVFVTGDAGEDHAWNLVKLDDNKWYWCDLTWDDTPTWEWGISYYYFMVNDTQNVNWRDSGMVLSEGSFTQSHTAATPNGQAQYFLYDLPARAENVYASKSDYLVRDTFEINGYTYAVAGYNTVQFAQVNVNGNVIIPETVKAADGNTYTVISIGEIWNGLFNSGCVLSTEMSECTVTIPSTVRFIWDYALSGYTMWTRTSAAITYFYVDSANEWFTAVDGVLFTKSMYTFVAYPSANKSETYTIPDEVFQIAVDAFRNCTNLKELVLGSGVRIFGITCWGRYYDDSHNVLGGGLQEILVELVDDATISVGNNPSFILEDGIIYNAAGTYIAAVVDQMETIVIKARVLDIFPVQYLREYNKRQHKYFVVEEGNEVYAAEGGVLYNKGKTKIVGALNNLDGEIRLADELLSFDNEFWSLRKITAYNIGANIKYLGKSILNNATIKQITFRGTMAQWLAIEKEEGWNNASYQVAKGFKIICTDGVLDAYGNRLDS